MHSENITEETRRELTSIILENYSFLAPLEGQAYPAQYWLHPRVCGISSVLVVEQGPTRLLLVPSARRGRLVGDEMLGAPSCSWFAACPAVSALRSCSRINVTYPAAEFRRFQHHAAKIDSLVRDAGVNVCFRSFVRHACMHVRIVIVPRPLV